MKKSLVALAVLGAFAGAASAQSSVTVFGTIDTNLKRVSADGAGSITRLHNNGLNAPGWGVKG